MAGIVGVQDLWVAGSRFFIQRSDDTNAALLDLGTISTANPTITPTNISLVDGDGGLRRTIDETQIETAEEYDLVCNNLNLDNLAMFFLAAAPESFSQTTSVINDVPHKAVKGGSRYVKLKDASGNWLYSINTIVVTDVAGTTTYVENTDWKWISKDRGIIQILAGSEIVEGDTLHIDITPNAISGKRLVRPQTGGGTIKGKALLIWGRNQNAQQTMREFTCSLTPSASNIQLDNYSSLTFKAKVLSDVTDQTVPAGRIVQAIGSIVT